MTADDVIGGCVQNRSCEQNANAKACLQVKLMAFLFTVMQFLWN